MYRYLLLFLLVSCSSIKEVKTKFGCKIYYESDLTELYHKSKKRFKYIIDEIPYEIINDSIRLIEREPDVFIDVSKRWSRYEDINYFELISGKRFDKWFWELPSGPNTFLFIAKDFAYVNWFVIEKNIYGREAKYTALMYKIKFVGDKVNVSLVGGYL